VARIRSIHPGIYTDEAWASVSIPARWFAKGICTEADDNGVFEWKPLQLKMRIFPADNVDLVALLEELEAAGIIMRFTGDGRSLGAVRNFCKYQRPRKPKAWFPITPEVGKFVALGYEITEPYDDECETVPKKSEPKAVKADPVPKKSEKSPQMEDGGGRRKIEAKASLSPGATKRHYPEGFEVVWKAYPHTQGRSSKPESLKLWAKLPEEEQAGLLGAIRRFTPNVEKICGGCGAPDMAVWLRQGKHLSWIEAEAARPSAVIFAGPQDVRQAVVQAKGEGFASAYLDHCKWDGELRQLLAKTDTAATTLGREVGRVLQEQGVSIGRMS